MQAVGRPHHRAAARRQNRRRGAGGQFIQGGLLKVPKPFFALAGKEGFDRAAKALLYHVVRVHKRHPQPPSELPPDGGLATAGQADEGDGGHSVTGR